jgi:hypothetical protein
MKPINTPFGVIADYINLEMHSATQPFSLLVMGPTELKTQHGTLIPQYYVEDMGRKEHKYLYFHPNGALKKLTLQESQEFKTQYGIIAAEHVLFYKDGTLKKLFPLAGKLSGYWTEEKEYELAEDLTIPLPSGPITAKMINIGFYKSGQIRSVTLWPAETVPLATPIGPIDIRTGIAFHETGEIKSVEPRRPTPVETPIGTIEAFDTDPEGISGDINSLNFGPDGKITSLTTTTSQISITDEQGTKKTYAPTEKESLCSESAMVSVPLQIEFIDGKVRFNKSVQDEYDSSACTFRVEPHKSETIVPTYDDCS